MDVPFFDRSIDSADTHASQQRRFLRGNHDGLAATKVAEDMGRRFHRMRAANYPLKSNFRPAFHDHPWLPPEGVTFCSMSVVLWASRRYDGFSLSSSLQPQMERAARDGG